MTLRTSIATAVVSGATHFLALLFALILFALGSFVLVVNVKALTIPLLVAVILLYAVSLLIAIPTQTKDAALFLEVHVVPYVPWAGGRRRDDPPADKG